ncbi:HNH endonuclease [Stenotrophomonas sp. YAU14D1_LEIMI4_1]|uniref:HNH endonuclease n=1 Tax=Stenotrophomonas sp. YAU14D1_LEIMI4_1 TaxID=2072407 RepID=UPI00131EEB08|nr:HNH endonuclease [Stenotrophomonas sp. YAU14D1_LEIMI4_1]
MIISIKDAWSDKVVEYHRDYVLGIINKASKVDGSWGAKYVAEFVARNEVAMSVGGVPDIKNAIDDFQNVVEGRSEKVIDNINKTISRIMSYSSFCDKGRLGWNAYLLCKDFKYVMCPYCQQSLAITVFRGKSGAYRPTLDHFYPKHKFPFLALSLYNLIPSCQSCNSSLKAAQDFSENEHLHPYESEESISFEIDVGQYVRSRAEGEKKWELRVVCDADGPAGNSVNTFAVRERYEMVRSFVDRFAASSYIRFSVNKEKYRELFSEEHIQDHLDEFMGFSPGRYRDEFMGKMKLDLYELIKGYRP